MQYKIFGENMPAVTMTLDAGESIYTQSGGMTWMTAGIRKFPYFLPSASLAFTPGRRRLPLRTVSLAVSK